MCNGAAAVRCYQAGAVFANAELVQVHPTAIPGADKLRLMSESARGEGGRIWVPRTKGDDREPRSIPEDERYYFLEEKYPKYGNIVPRDIASREIFDICVNEGLGIGGGNMVYLDLTHIDAQELEVRLGGIMDIYRKFAGEEPTEVPMKIYPGVHYTMGGLWTTYTAKDDLRGMVHGAPNTMMTNIPGLYAFGEVSYQYHGANRLGANALLSCIFDGIFGGLGVANYVTDELTQPASGVNQAVYDGAVATQQKIVDRLVEAKGSENPYQIGHELGEELSKSCTVIKSEPRMLEARAKVQELRGRYESIGLSDSVMWTNQNLAYARALGDMLALALIMVDGSLERKESRGGHYRTDYPDRDDKNFLKTTTAAYNADTGEPRIGFEDVEIGLVAPRARTYGKVADAGDKKEKKAPEATTGAAAGSGKTRQ
jgi:succinate dehydrogenase / fumarate reductase flavoprotein subunit